MLKNLVAYSAMLLAAAAVGCNRPAPTAPETTAESGHDEHGHAHHHHAAHGPHDGHLVELGGDESYHAEWVHDEASGKTIIYLLAGDAETEVRTAAEKLTVSVEGLAEPKTYEFTAVDADSEGKASRFESSDASVHVHLQTSGEGVTATIQAEIDGEMIQGKVEKHEHDHAH
jgi:hypothetical protein